MDVQFATLRGYVLRGDGQQAVIDAPVVAYYQNEIQRGVTCPGGGDGVAPRECATAGVRTSPSGEFVFDRIPAGRYRVTSFDRATYQQGEAGVIVAANATQSFNILLGQGLGTVRGVVLDAPGARVAGAQVGGGLSLTATDANGEFVLESPQELGGRLKRLAVEPPACGPPHELDIDLSDRGQLRRDGSPQAAPARQEEPKEPF